MYPVFAAFLGIGGSVVQLFFVLFFFYRACKKCAIFRYATSSDWGRGCKGN